MLRTLNLLLALVALNLIWALKFRHVELDLGCGFYMFSLDFGQLASKHMRSTAFLGSHASSDPYLSGRELNCLDVDSLHAYISAVQSRALAMIIG
jgi:hypothetical protein